jgi:hypothetical protein
MSSINRVKDKPLDFKGPAAAGPFRYEVKEQSGINIVAAEMALPRQHRRYSRTVGKRLEKIEV